MFCKTNAAAVVFAPLVKHTLRVANYPKFGGTSPNFLSKGNRLVE